MGGGQRCGRRLTTAVLRADSPDISRIGQDQRALQAGRRTGYCLAPPSLVPASLL